MNANAAVAAVEVSTCHWTGGERTPSGDTFPEVKRVRAPVDRG